MFNEVWRIHFNFLLSENTFFAILFSRSFSNLNQFHTHYFLIFFRKITQCVDSNKPMKPIGKFFVYFSFKVKDSIIHMFPPRCYYYCYFCCVHSPAHVLFAPIK
jgi:hypothetical protein